MPRLRTEAVGFYRSMGNTIRARRQEIGLSLEALGMRTGGLTRATISGIEKGRQRLSAYQLHLFAQALGVKTDDLIEKALAQEISFIQFAENDKKGETAIHNL